MKSVKCKDSRCDGVLGTADVLAFEKDGETTRVLTCLKCGKVRKFYLEARPRKA